MLIESRQALLSTQDHHTFLSDRVATGTYISYQDHHMSHSRRPPGFHERAAARGRLVAFSQHGVALPPGHLLRLGDVVSHTSHTHEPSVREPARH